MKIFIHIGYHKTGTSRLQQVFASHSDINLIERRVCQRLLLEPTPYDFDIESVEREFNKYVDPDKVNVISDEELSGNIHTGGNGRSITYEVIDRLSKFQRYDVHLIISIRNQLDMIDSCYRQYVKKGGCRPLVNYLYPERVGSHRFRFPGFSFSHFKYSDVISHGHRALGNENVTVFVYEAIKHSLEVPFFELFGLTYSNEGVTRPAAIVNRSYSDFALSVARLTNRFCAEDPICQQSIFTSDKLYRLLLKAYLSFPRQSRKKLLGNHIKQTINDFYAQDNAFTADLLKVDLKSLGYSVGASSDSGS